MILKIETQGGCLDTIVVNDAITYQPVKASVLHPELACLNDTVLIESDSEGLNLSLNWNFSSDTSSLVNVVYNTLGTNNIELIATDIYQCSDTVVSYVNITKPIADFTADNLSSNCPPLICSFTDLSSPSVSQWQWIFSDSTSSVVQNPSKVFHSSGLTMQH